MKNFLFFGYGSIAKKHIKILKKKIPKSRFYIIKKNPINNSDKNFIFMKNFESLKNFIFDAAFICSPVTSHFENINFIRNYVDVIFVEKPLVNDIKKFKKIYNIIKFNKNKIIVGYVFRFNKAFQFLKKEIKKKKYGKILNIESNYTSYLPLWRNKDFKKTVSYIKKLGGGVINESSHDLDILINLFKKVDVKCVKSFKKSDLNSKVEERVFIFGEIDKKIPFFTKLSFNEKILNRYLFLNYTNGSIFWDIIEQKIYLKIFKNKSIVKKSIFFKNSNIEMFEKQIDYVLSLRKNKFDKNLFIKEYDTLRLINEIKKKIK